jgi:hypothetical protein
MLRTLSAVAILTVLGCSSRITSAAGADQLSSMGGAEAALIFHLMDRYPPGDRVVCVGRRAATVDGLVAVDPEAHLLEQLRSAGYDAAPGGECRLRDFAGPMLHMPTGREAVLYQTTVVRRLGTRVELNGAYYAASLDGASCKYIVTLSDGAYIVTGESDCAVS